jgi:hypothetical protein
MANAKEPVWSDDLTIRPYARGYQTGEVCEWVTDISKTSGYFTHVLEHDDYATIEFCASGSDDGAYIDMSADELDALASVLSGIAACIRSRA